MHPSVLSIFFPFLATHITGTLTNVGIPSSFRLSSFVLSVSRRRPRHLDSTDLIAHCVTFPFCRTSRLRLGLLHPYKLESLDQTRTRHLLLHS
ncbi:hypothetical protein EDB92DRAFT_1900460 [Lactarius akahatsu]|uniref:Secreted protein n=1 Tax=Lactarius akahatsu TaxID=416441 RepID=A0AAD4Q3B3_9AGAM|nr:hypothetical protein EDB92DRAFT_1900207 [Lactarius akahatsu]KAH8980566.1 hypothetical protein EDB92DRAFT_1900460 [Lactarius akahatsu]